MTATPNRPPSAPRKKANLFQVIWIVVSGFFMIGRNKDYAEDAPRISPAQLVIVAVIGAVLFVVSIVTLVSFITK